MKNNRKFFTLQRQRPIRTKTSIVEVQHYQTHKEAARKIIKEKVDDWNQWYGFSYNRVTIKKQRRRWGSCSSLGNLNFNYKLIFLPSHLCDYIVVHELCHLKELHHGPKFWQTVAIALPHYQSLVQELRTLERNFGTSLPALTKVQAHYQFRATGRDSLSNDTVTNTL
jgi:predicted metal-dependent hydrolase